MPADQEVKNDKKIAWVSGTDLISELDAATWLETTRVLERLGWSVTLISEGSQGKQLIRGVEVHCLSRPRIYFLGSMLLHLRILGFLWRNRNEIDIIMFHQISAAWIFALRFLLRLSGRRKPWFVMDTRDVPDYGSGVKHWLRVIYFQAMQRMANRWADGQTAITPKMAELVKIPPAKLLGTWSSGADINRFKPAQSKRKWPTENGPVLLVYTGKLHYERKLLELCEAIVRVNKAGMRFGFTLVGDGPQRMILQQFAQGSEGAVIVLDPINYEDIPVVLQEAHIGVTPLPAWDDRKFEASSPIKMFEYMAAGLALLSTRNICHTSVVKGGKYVFWADDGKVENLCEALNLIWQQRRHLPELGGEAAKASTDWSWYASGSKLSTSLRACLLNTLPDDALLDLNLKTGD